MALEIRQSLKLTQTLIMTQKLQQAIKLLQLSRMELLDEIHQAIEANPVLEDTQSEDRGQNQAEGENWTPSTEGAAAEAEPGGDGESKSPLDDWDWTNFFRDQEATPSFTEREDRELPSFENLNAQKTSLKAHLTWQMRMAGLSEADEHIATLIIGNIDPQGYLQASAEEIAQELEVDTSRVEEVLRIVQTFDPTGVAARDLKECLLVQVKALGIDDPLIIQIISRHLPIWPIVTTRPLPETSKCRWMTSSTPTTRSPSSTPNPAAASTWRTRPTSTPMCSFRKSGRITSSP